AGRIGAMPTRCELAAWAKSHMSRGRSLRHRWRFCPPYTSHSLRQLLEPQPDEHPDLGALARIARRRSDRGRGLRLAIAEIDQRRNRVADRLRRALVFERAGVPHHSRIDLGVSWRLVF